MASNNATIVGSGLLPWYSPIDFELAIKDEKSQKSLADMLQLNQVVSYPFPSFRLTKEQWEHIEPLRKTLGTYVDESLARFVIGEWDTSDEQWKLYIEGLKE